MIDQAAPLTRLTLEPLIVENGQGQVIPPEIRLRQLLKSLLRAYGFRCVKVEEVPQEPEV